MDFFIGVLTCLILMFAIVLILEFIQNVAKPKEERKALVVLVLENQIASSCVVLCGFIVIILELFNHLS